MKHDSTVLINEGLYLEDRSCSAMEQNFKFLTQIRSGACSAYVEEIISSGAIVYG